MKDICLCGHERKDHAAHYQACLKCVDPGKVYHLAVPAFTCKPGHCDRFTWDAVASQAAK